MLDVEFAQLSDPGSVRTDNEDFIGYVAAESSQQARDHGWLFVLADGVGGHDRGEVASRLAVETVTDEFRKARPSEPPSTILPRCVERANLRIYEAAMSTGPGGSNMATTVVACCLRYDRALIAHVGDSRCYLVRQGFATSITKDHTFAAEQLRMGLISAREAVAAQTSHILSRSLGGGMFVNVECCEQQLFPGDVLLLCSDGLHNSVGNDDIAAVVKADHDLKESARGLVALAKQRDGGDNISIQLIRVRGVEQVGMYRGRHYKLR